MNPPAFRCYGDPAAEIRGVRRGVKSGTSVLGWNVMRSLSLIVFSTAFSALIGIGPCLAQSEPGATGSGTAQAAEPSAGAVVIDEVARRILHDYYQRNAEAW